MKYILFGYDTDKLLVLIQNRKAVDLFLLHQIGSFDNIGIRSDCDRIQSHSSFYGHIINLLNSF